MMRLAELPQDCFTWFDYTWREPKTREEQLRKLVEHDNAKRERDALAYRQAKLEYLTDLADKQLPMD